MPHLTLCENLFSEMAARGTHAHSITTSIDFCLQPSQEASLESSQMPNTPQTAKSTETESEKEEQRKRKKQKTRRNELVDTVNHIICEFQEGRAQRVREAEQRARDARSPYEKAIEIVVTEYNNEGEDWQFEAFKALEAGNNAIMFLAMHGTSR
jgi:hypothetical protein